MVACIYVSIVILQAVVVSLVSAAQSPAILSVRNVVPGATATFECSLPSVANPNTLNIYKDNTLVYTCITIAFTCSKTSSDTDYSVVTFTALGTESAKGTFTVANADQTRDGGKWTCIYGTSLKSSPDTFVVSDPSRATLSVTNVLQGVTATFECSYPNLESPTSLHIHKDMVALYQCTDIALKCSNSDNDYSDVTFTDLDTSSAKGTFTVANADQTEDGGHWKCQYGTSLESHPVNFVVTGASTTQTATPPTVSSTRSSTVSSLSTSASSSTGTVPTIQESETTPTNPTTTSARNTKATTTSARNNTDETNKEWELVYFFSIVPTMITLTVVMIVITFVCNRTRKIKLSRPPSGMDKYSLSRYDTRAFEPPVSYSMSMEHSNPFYVSREHMLNGNTGSSGTDMIHDQIFVEDTCSKKELLEGIEGLHFAARYIRNWSDLNDSSVNLFK